METFYADILSVDYDSVRDCVLQKEGLKHSQTGDRIVIKWHMENSSSPIEQCIVDLIGTPVFGENYRDKAGAVNYYQDPLNDWRDPEANP